MENSFRLHDIVEWTSQSQASRLTKRGEIVAIVPAKTPVSACHPEAARISASNGTAYGGPRDHESYYIFVQNKSGGGKYYWPNAGKLKLVSRANGDFQPGDRVTANGAVGTVVCSPCAENSTPVVWDNYDFISAVRTTELVRI